MIHVGLLLSKGYYGYYSCVVGPRAPLKKDPDLDYDVDSDEEWEEVSILI